MRTALLLALLAVCCLAGPGCAGGPAENDPDAAARLPDTRPPDFALGLTVYTPEGPVRRPGQRAARYALGPDGWLRAAVGAGATVRVYPPLVRRLSGDERDTLYEAVRAAGFDDVPAQLRLASPETFDAPSGRRVYLVEITAGGDRRSVTMPEGEPETEGFIALADLLAEWSWVRP